MVEYKKTSYSEGFGIFNRIHKENLDGVNNNVLNLYMLNTENKLFNYDQLYEYLLQNICQYVFDRRKINETQNDPIKSRTIILDALSQLRKITSNKDQGAGGELGEILLYIFLEQDLNAPKLFSKVELKTNPQDYVKGADGIHFKFRTDTEGKKILQLVIGEAKIVNDLNNGINAAFKSINTYLSNNTQEIILLDTHLMNQMVDEEEANELKEYILSVPRKKKETVFGIFIGYSIKYEGKEDNNDNYDKKIIQENLQQVMNYRQKIIDKINDYHVSNYEFNFYFLPFHNAMNDRKIIIDQLTSGHPHFSWEEIRNG